MIATALLLAQSVAFVNVTVLPMDRDRVLENHTVVVQDGRITWVGPAAGGQVPAGAVRIDGRGKYLMPGFAEMHGHLSNPDAPGTTAELVEAVLFLYVANGVTSVRGMQGNPGALVIRDRIARGELLGPRLWVAGPALSGTTAPTPDSARRLVEAQKAAGYDHIKIQERLTRDTYDTIVATAKRVGIPFAGHVPDAITLEHAVASGQISVDHFDNFFVALERDDSPIRGADAQTRGQQLVFYLDEAKLPPLVARLKSAGTWNVPTVALWETFNATPLDSLEARAELRYVPRQWVATWTRNVSNMRRNAPNTEAGLAVVRWRRQILKALADGGARIVFGTDSPQLFSVPGFSIHREIRVMREAGLTPFQILESGTRRVAEYYGTDALGTVGTGKRADLILLEANPLADPANLARRAGVMLNGRWIAESEIQAGLARLAERFAQ
jgi:imidazolonepropionase-like amidohydrolase